MHRPSFTNLINSAFWISASPFSSISCKSSSTVASSTWLPPKSSIKCFNSDGSKLPVLLPSYFPQNVSTKLSFMFAFCSCTFCWACSRMPRSTPKNTSTMAKCNGPSRAYSSRSSFFKPSPWLIKWNSSSWSIKWLPSSSISSMNASTISSSTSCPLKCSMNALSSVASSAPLWSASNSAHMCSKKATRAMLSISASNSCFCSSCLDIAIRDPNDTNAKWTDPCMSVASPSLELEDFNKG